jgi:hypothetical protein
VLLDSEPPTKPATSRRGGKWNATPCTTMIRNMHVAALSAGHSARHNSCAAEQQELYRRLGSNNGSLHRGMDTPNPRPAHMGKTGPPTQIKLSTKRPTYTTRSPPLLHAHTEVQARSEQAMPRSDSAVEHRLTAHPTPLRCRSQHTPFAQHTCTPTLTHSTATCTGTAGCNQITPASLSFGSTNQ